MLMGFIFYKYIAINNKQFTENSFVILATILKRIEGTHSAPEEGGYESDKGSCFNADKLNPMSSLILK